jgi:site-specific recombinase XerD
MSDLPVLYGDVIEGSSLPAIIEQPSDQNPAAVAIASKTSKHSQRSTRQSLDRIAYYFIHQTFPANDNNAKDLCFSVNWSELRYQHTAAIRAALQQQYKPGTVNVMLSALRGVLKECKRLGQMSPEEFDRAVDFKNVKGETIPAGRDLAGGEIAALFRACNGDKKQTSGIRDSAIIAILYICGLRRSEVASLDVSDYDQTSGKITIRHGKGRKERTAYAGEAAAYIERWIEQRGTDTSVTAALFLPLDKADKIQREQTERLSKAQHEQGITPKKAPARLTPQTIYDMLQRRGNMAGIPDFSPHDFRRTFVGDLLTAGADIVTVQKMAGHASVTTTARYDRRPEELKQKAASLLHIPRPGAMF